MNWLSCPRAALVAVSLLTALNGAPWRAHAGEPDAGRPAFTRRGPGETGRAASDRLDTIKRRGFLTCGVRSTDLPGFLVRQDGRFSGFDVDFCRAVAVAIFADTERVQFVPLALEARLASVREGIVDLFIGGVTQTLTRDGSVSDGGDGLNFAPPIFHDGQSFLVSTAITTNPDDDLVALLNGKTVCARQDTTNETNLRDFILDNGITAVVFTDVSPGSSGDPALDFEQGRCDALTADRSFLFVRQPGFSRPTTLMNRLISREPLAPVLGGGGDRERFEHVVRWVVYATFAAEAMGIERGNVGVIPSNGEGRRLLGYSPGLGQKLGLANDWAFQVIRLVGNYGEIFARNLPGLPRGPNAVPPAGGLLFFPPFQ